MRQNNISPLKYSKVPIFKSKILTIIILFEVILQLGQVVSSQSCFHFNLTNPAIDLKIPARTNRIILEVLPAQEIEIVGFEEDLSRLDSHSIYFQEKLAPNQLLIKLQSLLQQQTKNFIPFTQQVDLLPILNTIMLKNCDPEQKIASGHYKLFIKSQVLQQDENTDKESIIYQTISSIDGSFYIQSEANKLIEHLNIKPSTIVKIEPNNFAIIAANQLDKQRVVKYKTLLQNQNGILTSIIITLENSDYRKSHYCHLYQLSQDGLQNTQIYKVRGQFQGSNQVRCDIPTDFNLIGILYTSLFINNQYYTNFIQLNSYEVNDIQSINPRAIHGQTTNFDITFDIPQTSGNLPSSIKLQIDGTYYKSIQLEFINGNNSSKNSIVRYIVRISTPIVNKPTYSGIIKYSLNEKDFYQSEQRLQYLPDIFVQDIQPKEIYVNQATQIKILIQNIQREVEYWCQLSTGQRIKGVVKQSYVAQYNINKDYLFCQIPAFDSLGKIRLEIVTNNGQYKTKADNYLMIKELPKFELDDDSKSLAEIDQAFLNNIPFISKLALIYFDNQYSLSFNFNKTLLNSQSYYCLFENDNIRILTYLYQEQEMIKYSCSTPIFQNNTGEQNINVTIVDQENHQLTTNNDLQLSLLQPIQIQDKQVTMGLCF